MKKLMLVMAIFCSSDMAMAQQNATIKEYDREFKTYPFSDPDPVPEASKIYPYFRFDGYTNTPVNKKWKVVELENDFIKVMVMPEIGGKIWAAIDKATDKSFIYYNQVVKFRDVAMRGPWTSGGLEPNYGIVGHTPNCATPVDFTIMQKPDGSVSCVVGVLDLLTRSVWRLEINLQKDKSYFTTRSTWYNGSPFEQPYYHWMNGALRAANDLEFIFPGTKYIGHGGEYARWPIDEKGRNLSFYRNNNFGSYKSYHVFGKHSNFWGVYYHDEDFGMARFSGYDGKPGKKIWIWGLSREGMIWEDLLTDNDGQYVEVQSGRLFNQPAEGSSFTPFKNRGFTPGATDTWTEYWFPVKNTKGLAAASPFAALNVVRHDDRAVIYLLANQPINDTLYVQVSDRIVSTKKVSLKTLEIFIDSVSITPDNRNLQITLGDQKLNYNAVPGAGDLSRPFSSPDHFDWNSVQGLHLQGKEYIRQRMYQPAQKKLEEALEKDSNYLPALSDHALLMYRQMRYEEGLRSAKHALSIDAYDPAANYYYGLINERLGNYTDAKDGFDIATQSVEYRSAAYYQLAQIHHRESNNRRAALYARKSIGANYASLDAWQMLAVIYRDEQNRAAAYGVLDTIISIDPLSHFARFEKYLNEPSTSHLDSFAGMIRNEMPEQTYLELASWYLNAGRNSDALKLLKTIKEPGAEVVYWKSFLEGSAPSLPPLRTSVAFPFRHESAMILDSLLKSHEHWILKYHAGLIRWNNGDTTAARTLLLSCADQPDYAPFYSVRAKLLMTTQPEAALSDLKRAQQLDPSQWRYGRALVNYYTSHKQFIEARNVAAAEFKKHPDNYILGMLLAKASMDAGDYEAANGILSKISVLPNEGATAGRLLYRDTKLMLALSDIKSRNFKRALVNVKHSKEWPERLGSGKPYQDDIDERLEDWMLYRIYTGLKNNTEANKALDKIFAYSTEQAGLRRPSLNDYFSAMAIVKRQNKEAALDYLQKKLQKFPGSEIIEWITSKIQQREATIPQEITTNINYSLFKELEAIK